MVWTVLVARALKGLVMSGTDHLVTTTLSPARPSMRIIFPDRRVEACVWIFQNCPMWRGLISEGGVDGRYRARSVYEAPRYQEGVP